MAEKLPALGGAGLLVLNSLLMMAFISELPRPHDTGMVTLAGTQNFNEFELHLRYFKFTNI
jgi:phosphoribosylglycinamide formyltransferase 2